MSQILRQSNLFAAEDFTKIYKSFQDIDFTAYDFDTIKNAMVEYIQVHFPEDFDDYIESSEFIAIIELLAYLGTSLAFRVDLNSRENVMDTAQRRESIIRLARMINYTPKRNIAANGMFKISSLLTDQPLTDSVGNSISNIRINWADPNNPDWFDQFVTLLNNALNPTNPFGKPSKSGTVGSIPTDLYALNNVLGLNVTFPITVQVNGESIPIDIVNPDFEDGMTFSEKHPDPNEAFSFIYRNDSLGMSSNNSGFFLHFRQGTLQNSDEAYEFPEPNRVQELDATNVNQTDVFFQEIDDTGEVQTKWQSVPTVSGTNVIYNSINFEDRDIFEVISGLNDSVSVKFPDGNFGNIPTGIYRYWYRTSIGRNIVIRPEDASQLQITIPYNGIDNQTYRMQVTFDLKQTISNSSPAETNEQIKLRAPQTFYTQERMINNEDYNVFPLTYGNTIAKLRSINRTHAGHSRFISVNDPTGFNNNLTVLGEDGALYNEPEPQRQVVELTDNIIGDVSEAVFSRLEEFIRDNDEMKNFFYNDYLNAFRETFGEDYFVLPTDEHENYWKTSPDKYKNDTGFLIDSLDDSNANWPYDSVISLSEGTYSFITAGSILTLHDENDSESSTSVRSVTNFGEPIDPAITDTGTVELGSEMRDLQKVIEVTPNFRTVFNESDPVDEIKELIKDDVEFGLGYDVIKDQWYIIGGGQTPITPGTGEFNITKDDNDPNSISRDNPDSWLVKMTYPDANYEFESKGTVTVFESLKQVRFYWDPDQRVLDAETGKSLVDSIEILPRINNDVNGEPLDRAIFWSLNGVYIYEDGFQDPAKVKVMPADLNEDGTADFPDSFNTLVSTSGDDSSEVVFEKFIDIDGYEKTRPWIDSWNNDLLEEDIVDIVISENNPNEVTDNDQGFKAPNDSSFVPLSEANLFIFKNKNTIENIAEQLTTSIQSNNAAIRTNAKKFIVSLQTKSMRAGKVGTNIGQSGVYNTVMIDTVSTISAVNVINDDTHFGRNGITSTQDTNVPVDRRYDFTFKWEHYAPTDQRIDPSISNIIDMTLLTESYYESVLVWKDERGSALTLPAPPTTEDLRVQFSELNAYKAISDQIVFNSGVFKILFGPQAEDELQATFKAVKIQTANISKNELKTKIIQAIDQYFDINNWDFGERFYYTELAAFIHTQLSKYLSSVVIVPTKAESEFGNLFEIVSNPNEIFLSTATVDNVEIVSNFTETNLRL